MKQAILLLVMVFLLCAFFAVSVKETARFLHNWQVVSVPMDKADAVIVLGGEHETRPKMAATLFQNGTAPVIYVTGIGDAGKCRQVLMEAGVPPERILMETKAISTFMNAQLLKPMLEANHVHTALIVTSPFHTRRALATFRKVIPEIRFGVTAAPISRWMDSNGRSELNRLASLEFIKSAGYWLLYGVSPFSVGNEGGKTEN